MPNEKINTSDRELRMTRTLNAPVDLVWEAWSNPEHIASWWGPEGFTTTITRMDLRPGGEWALVMHGPDGTEYDNLSVFKEVIPNEKIVYEHVSYPSFIAIVEFTPLGEQTMLNWYMLFESAELMMQVVKTFKADKGLKQNGDKLEVYLKKIYAGHS